MPSASVIIPTHNRADLLGCALHALECQTAPLASFEVIVADDGSSDGTAAMLAEWHSPLRLRTIKLVHAGPNAARNRAADVAQGDLLLFLGDDMLAEPGLVEAHLDAHARHPEDSVGVLGHIAWAPDLAQSPFMRFLGEPDCSLQCSFTGFDPLNVPLGRLYGSNHSVKRAFFERHGGFDESFSLPAYDDIELECRYRRSGFRLVYEPHARAGHYHVHTIATFCDRMRMAGRVSVRLHRLHPETIVVTDIGTQLALRVDEDELAGKVAQLQQDEDQLQGLPPNGNAFMQAYGGLRIRWQEAIVEAAALGTHDAVRESGWSILEALKQAREAAADPSAPPRVTLRLGAHGYSDGLSAVGYLDSRTEDTEEGGRECVRLVPSPMNNLYLYVQVDSHFLSSCDGPVTVAVDYRDRSGCSWALEYDSADEDCLIVPTMPGAFKATRWVRARQPGRWRTASFRLDDWLFSRRCNNADFRICVVPEPGADFCVSRVAVTRTSAKPVAAPPETGGSKRVTTGAGPAPVRFDVELEPDVSVIIPVHGLQSYTASCLAALREATEGRYEVIVVDDASPDGTSEYLAACKGVRVVHHDTNRGFAVACNAGARAARAGLLLFLNNDTLPLPGWMTALRSSLSGSDRVGIVGAKLLYPHMRGIQHAGVSFTGFAPYHKCPNFPPHHPSVARTRPVAAVTGACILMRRSHFQMVDGFDERYRNGYEDIDLCLKLARHGLSSVYCAQSVLYHHCSMTPGRHAHETENFGLFARTWAKEIPVLIAPYV